MQGDSGGSCFNLLDGYRCQVASVHSYQRTECSGCTPEHYAGLQTGAEVFRAEARVAMDWVHGTSSWSFGSTPTDAEAVAPSPLYSGTPSWTVSGGQLRENSNAYGSSSTFEGPLYLQDGIYGNVEARVTVTSSDNDAAGLVLRYFDLDHYYRASFDEERGYLRIYRRSGGQTVQLASRAIDIDHSNAHQLIFRAWEGKLQAVLTGSDVNETLTVTDNSNAALQAGRVGIYEWGLTGARFDDFQAVGLTGSF